MTTWDQYFMSVAHCVSKRSHCLSRQIGAVLVRDRVIVATGYNGPPRGAPHCGMERYKADPDLFNLLRDKGERLISEHCPRRLLGYGSGLGLHLCWAAHAERNCLCTAARLGIPVNGATLYLNSIIPCKDCAVELINAGVRLVVCEELKAYDTEAPKLFSFAGVMVIGLDQIVTDSNEIERLR